VLNDLVKDIDEQAEKLQKKIEEAEKAAEDRTATDHESTASRRRQLRPIQQPSARMAADPRIAPQAAAREDIGKALKGLRKRLSEIDANSELRLNKDYKAHNRGLVAVLIAQAEQLASGEKDLLGEHDLETIQANWQALEEQERDDLDGVPDSRVALYTLRRNTPAALASSGTKGLTFRKLLMPNSLKGVAD
jgi:Sec-independent protein translocase protein TatA